MESDAEPIPSSTANIVVNSHAHPIQPPNPNDVFESKDNQIAPSVHSNTDEVDIEMEEMEDDYDSLTEPTPTRKNTDQDKKPKRSHLKRGRSSPGNSTASQRHRQSEKTLTGIRGSNEKRTALLHTGFFDGILYYLVYFCKGLLDFPDGDDLSGIYGYVIPRPNVSEMDKSKECITEE